MSFNKTIYILGEGGVGKSALTIRFINNKFIEEYDPTIEDSYRKNIFINDKNYVVDLVDTAGQEEYKSMRNQCINKGECFLLVYSIDNPNSLDELETIMDQITRIKDNKKISLVLVANKIDLEIENKDDLIRNAHILANNWDIPFLKQVLKQISM